jgi:hypothetical protein
MVQFLRSGRGKIEKRMSLLLGEIKKKNPFAGRWRQTWKRRTQVLQCSDKVQAILGTTCHNQAT